MTNKLKRPIYLLVIFIIFVIYSNNNKKFFSPKNTLFPAAYFSHWKSPNKVPPIVHYIYLGGNNWEVNEHYKPNIGKCIEVNPSYTFVLWTEINLKVLLASDKVTNLDRENMNPNVRKKVSRTDVLRLILIKVFGGVYLDMDTICQKPLDIYLLSINNNTCQVGREPPIQSIIHVNITLKLYNGFIVCTPNHPFFEKALSQVDPKQGYADHMISAGPSFLTQQLENYWQEEEATTITSSSVIQTADYKYIFPNVRREDMRKSCKTNPQELCKQMENHFKWLDKEGEANAVLLHEWIGLAYEKHKNGFDALKEFPNFQIWPPPPVYF